MATKLPKTDEAGLNMTPMIDIVFQLILFFLFNLRFKSMDYRIESSLPNVGMDATPVLIEPEPHIKVSLFRVDGEDAKEIMLADPRGIFFTTPHWNGYPAVLLHIPDLKQLSKAELTAAQAELSRARAMVARAEDKERRLQNESEERKEREDIR